MPHAFYACRPWQSPRNSLRLFEFALCDNPNIHISHSTSRESCLNLLQGDQYIDLIVTGWYYKSIKVFCLVYFWWSLCGWKHASSYIKKSNRHHFTNRDGVHQRNTVSMLMIDPSWVALLVGKLPTLFANKWSTWWLASAISISIYGLKTICSRLSFSYRRHGRIHPFVPTARRKGWSNRWPNRFLVYSSTLIIQASVLSNIIVKFVIAGER